MAFSIETRTRYREVDCNSCGAIFGMPERLAGRTWGDNGRTGGGNFWCPWCGFKHRGVGESDLDRARRDAKRAEARARERLERLEAERRRHAATKGQLTKIKKRTAGGACPCCNRTFVALARHIKTKHPDYAADLECECGRVCVNRAGLASHRRSCPTATAVR